MNNPDHDRYEYPATDAMKDRTSLVASIRQVLFGTGFTSKQWKGLMNAAVVMVAVGVVLTIAASLRGYMVVSRLGTFLAAEGFCLFLLARIMFSRSRRYDAVERKGKAIGNLP